MTEYEEEATPDPFSPNEAPGLQLIVQMRIYDVLCAIYTEMTMDENGVSEKARNLLEAHSKGLILGPLPLINLPPAEPTS